MRYSENSERPLGYSLDRRACHALGEDVNRRSVFMLANSVEAFVGDGDLGEALIDAADGAAQARTASTLSSAIDDAESLLENLTLPRGYMLVGVGDLGTGNNPTHGIVDVSGVSDLPLISP